MRPPQIQGLVGSSLETQSSYQAALTQGEQLARQAERQLQAEHQARQDQVEAGGGASGAGARTLDLAEPLARLRPEARRRYRVLTSREGVRSAQWHEPEAPGGGRIDLTI